ncbi:hypothetical protein PHISCL_10440, partial [Aspergillus sclerotialis]
VRPSRFTRGLVIHLPKLFDGVFDARQRDLVPEILELLVERRVEGGVIDPDHPWVVVLLVAGHQQAVLGLEFVDGVRDIGPAVLQLRHLDPHRSLLLLEELEQGVGVGDVVLRFEQETVRFLVICDFGIGVENGQEMLDRGLVASLDR